MNRHVIIVSDRGYITGGAGNVAINTAIELSNVIDTLYFCSIGPVCNELLQSKTKVICLNQREPLKDRNRIRGFFSNLFNKKAEKKLLEIIDNFGNEEVVVHIHGWTKALTSSIFKKLHKYKNVRVILTLHDYFYVCPNGGLYNYKKQIICDKKGGSFKCLLCNCDKKNYLTKLFRYVRFVKQKKDMKCVKDFIYISSLNKRVFENNVSFKPNLYYLPNFTSCKKQFIADVQTKKYFGYIGRLDLEKGIDIFCEAITLTGVEAMVIGDGQLRQTLESKYKNIKFVGWIGKEDYPKYFSDIKCFVFPSKWYEGAPLVLKEVFSFGIPFLVSDCSSAVEEIVDGKNGFVFGNSVEDLVKTIERTNNKTIERMSNYIKKTFNPDDYSIENYISGVIEIYNKLFRKEN